MAQQEMLLLRQFVTLSKQTLLSENTTRLKDKKG